MAIVIAAGTYLGVWLDEKYPNQYSAYTVVCSLFAVFASLYNVFRQLKNINKKNNS
jgi:small basic protein